MPNGVGKHLATLPVDFTAVSIYLTRAPGPRVFVSGSSDESHECS